MTSNARSTNYINPLILLLSFTVLPILLLLQTLRFPIVFDSVSSILTSIPTPPDTFITINTPNTSNMSAAKLTWEGLLPFLKNRRSHYAVTKDIPISKARVQEIVNDATLHTPSAFNTQTTRVAVLFENENVKFWDIIGEALKPKVPAEKWADTEGRFNMFKGAAGAILFFQDEAAVKAMQERTPAYAHFFPTWAGQSAAIQEYITWTGLEAEGVGASLQHLNGVADAQVVKQWGLPESWKLDAQLVFGKISNPAKDKDYKPLEERVKVFGA